MQDFIILENTKHERVHCFRVYFIIRTGTDRFGKIFGARAGVK